MTDSDLALLIDGPDNAEVTILLAHGAGAGMEHEFMQQMAEELAAKSVRVVRFEFPYMIKRREDGKKRPPDHEPKLLESFEQHIRHVQQQFPNSKLVIGGKSMGGRMAALIASQQGKELELAGVFCLGFPLHPPGKPEKIRGEYLATIDTPTLLLQGERDTFGTQTEIEAMALSKQVSCGFLPDGDHSFKPRKVSGFTQEQHIKTAAGLIEGFVGKL